MIMDHKQYVMNYIKEIEELLDFEYGSPDHNNKKNPLDELVFILLSRRTPVAEYESVYDELRAYYPTWKKVAEAPREDIQRIVERAGLGSKRVEEIQENLLAIKKKFGRYSLHRLKKWNKNMVFDYLTSLKGIGPKSAYCIMMYSLERDVFPADTHVNRICQRLGIIDTGLDHKKSQKLLANMFPQKLRYSIHVNMLAHGRKICTPSKPKCEQCVISGFCEYPRVGKKPKEDNRFIDLFAGAGGISLGFENAGFNLYAAIEMDTRACDTLLHNRLNLTAESVFNGNIRTLDPKQFKGKNIKLIIAGPPCQEFSRVHKNNLGKQGRNELYKEVLRFVKAIKPKVVVIENVPGMASHLNKEYVKRVERGLRKARYEVKSDLINSKKFRIPQNRQRLFFIARRVYGNNKKKARKVVNSIWDNIRELESDERISFKQGVSGLPRLAPSEGADVLLNGSRGRPSVYAIEMNYNGGPLFNHTAREHNPRDLEAYALMEEGENALDLHSKRPDLMPYSTENFPTKYFKIRNDRPSPTIVAHLRRDANSFIHPRDSRGISPREAARLQSFPDNYRFLGTFGLQFEQIGNAVPPRLAEMIGKVIMEEIMVYKGGLLG